MGVLIVKKIINKTFKCFALSFAFLSLVGCSTNIKPEPNQTGSETVDENGVVEVNNDNKAELPSGGYNEGIILVKKADFNNSMLGELEYKNVTQLYKNSSWQKIELKNKDKTSEAVEYLSSLNTFDKVEYDYIMGSDGTVESIDVSSNPNSGEQGYLDAQGIFDGWGYQKANNKIPGGSSDVVVAVIDTGVDYNHIDLRNNIWTNTGEIPNNGIDDDNNGYIDDVHGWDCVGDDNDPMDDNGHGTHVAGIVAAENNTVGTVGVAFNCKIMPIKAGNSSGFFNNSDIAEAIQYAYMNGASVINMSFGGSSISSAVKDALEDAYNQCVLVAAAGNDGLCNNTAHASKHDVGVSYPAALPYVIGVMSTNCLGTSVSSFSNYDDTPFDKVEYETYACGEQVISTWPNNKIAKMSGTSMACPVVSGIAALLRSSLTDRDVYSNKYIQSQIVNTGSINPINYTLKAIDNDHSFANVYEALTKTPKPSVSLFDNYSFDNTEFSSKNNGDGVIDAGETIHLAIEVYNHGGVAKNVVAKISTNRNGDSSLVDPYITIVTDTISLGDIGTYSVRDCGKIYNESTAVGTNIYFEIKIAENCPNDYLANINLTFTYRNGMDSSDISSYSKTGEAQLLVFSGAKLPEIINQNMTFSGDKVYIIDKSVTISSGVEVVFEEGAVFKCYDTHSSEILKHSPAINVYGTLRLCGSETKNITFTQTDSYASYPVRFIVTGTLDCRYTNFDNVFCDGDGTENYSHCTINYSKDMIMFNEDAPVWDYKINFKNLEYCSINLCFGYLDQIDASFSNLNYCKVDYLKNTGTRYAANTNVFFSHCENSLFRFWGSTNKIVNFNDVHNSLFDDPYPNIMTTKDLPMINLSSCSSNKFTGKLYRNASDIIKGYITSEGNYSFDIDDVGTYNEENIWPFITEINIYNSEGELVTVVGKDKVRFEILFNRDMDTSIDLSVYFGTKSPFADYKIKGSWITARKWSGEYSLKAFIENGKQQFRIVDARSSDDSFLKLDETGKYFGFAIDTTAAMSMSIQAYTANEGIHLEWAQDDYDTLMGYNVYRSTSKDGNFVRLNNSVIPADENTFIDENAEPGVTYWYTFTVVFSDMSESAPAGKVSCTAADTIAPSIYHTPVNQGYSNNNLVISCTASDNIGVQNVTLYYRTKGQNDWKSLAMLKQNDRYSATIFGSEITLEGLEYYIVVSDGINTINKGSAENPYSVIIKDSSTISQLGDVDGDGVITTKDALMIMQSINGDLLLSDDQFKRADLNKDNVLSSVEALRILQYINGNVSTLEM